MSGSCGPSSAPKKQLYKNADSDDDESDSPIADHSNESDELIDH
ncbi:MAG: hypothetical protein R3C03_03805 [Pirellulaceae bacterium]